MCVCSSVYQNGASKRAQAVYSEGREGLDLFVVNNRKPENEVTWVYISWRGLNQHYKVKSCTVHSDMRGGYLKLQFGDRRGVV